MGQLEIMNFLKEKYLRNPNKWFSCLEIKAGVSIGTGSIARQLLILRKTDFILKKQIRDYLKFKKPQKKPKLEWRYKHNQEND